MLASISVSRAPRPSRMAWRGWKATAPLAEPRLTSTRVPPSTPSATSMSAPSSASMVFSATSFSSAGRASRAAGRGPGAHAQPRPAAAPKGPRGKPPSTNTSRGAAMIGNCASSAAGSPLRRIEDGVGQRAQRGVVPGLFARPRQPAGAEQPGRAGAFGASPGMLALRLVAREERRPPAPPEVPAARSCRLRGHRGVARRLQLARQLRPAGAHDAPGHQHVHAGPARCSRAAAGNG